MFCRLMYHTLIFMSCDSWIIHGHNENFMPPEINFGVVQDFHGHKRCFHGSSIKSRNISWNFHGHERFFMGHELSHIIFNGIFMGLTKAMKWGISIFMTMKNGFMGF